MNPIQAIGQLLVSISLMAAILLQARGAGLSGTFGGDSAVYRSRRGVEKRLWQFTIVLLVLFVIFSIASYKLVAQGLNNREIAKRLFISENTVKNHVRNILEKLQLHSRMEAVMYAVKEKLLDLP